MASIGSDSEMTKEPEIQRDAGRKKDSREKRRGERGGERGEIGRASGRERV